ncbi:MAG: hypothetical protein KGS47_05350 [Chloroflexi bacterium]|nr:hypothetical protein [Chloroflexota bacterium]
MMTSPDSSEPVGSSSREIIVDAVVDGGMIRPRTRLPLADGTTMQIRLRIDASLRILDAPAEPTHEPRAALTPAAPAPAAPRPSAHPRRVWQALRSQWSARMAPLMAAAAALPLSQRLGLTVLALGMVFGGQLMMHAETAVSAMTLTLALAGAACVAWATSDLPLWQRERIGPAMVPIWSPARIGLLVLAVAGMLGVLGVRRGTSGISVGPWVLAAWGAIIGAYAAATTPWQWPRWRRPRRSLWIIAGIGLLAAVARDWQAGALPATLAGDETRFGRETRAVLSGGISDPFATGWLSVPTMTFFFNAPSVAWVSDPVLGLRLP